MSKILIVPILIIVLLTGCTDKEAEEMIEGQWQAIQLTEADNGREHVLPDGIHLHFDYPKYRFDGDLAEQGNYYIKDQTLHLIPLDQDEQRNITILRLSPDTLILKLVDSLGARSVEFLKQ